MPPTRTGWPRRGRDAGSSSCQTLRRRVRCGESRIGAEWILGIGRGLALPRSPGARSVAHVNIEGPAKATPPKRVAVIAVHGVGSPPAGQTARSVTELLMQGTDSAPRYRWFEERSLFIPTAPLDAGPDVKDTGSHIDRAMRSFVNANTDTAEDRTSFLRTPDQASIEEAALRPDI